jgi:N-acetylneuraminic acid mutarotase
VVLIVPVTTAEQHPPASRVLSFEKRVEYQRLIEEVYWRHRMDSVAATTPRVPFEKAVPESVIRAKVEKGLKQSQALERYWDRPIKASQLQAEMNRMARESRMPDRLHELFAALDHDPYVIAEVLARPVLAERLLRNWWKGDPRFCDGRTFDAWWDDASRDFEIDPGASDGMTEPPKSGYDEPSVRAGTCIRDTWEFIDPGVPAPGGFGPAVWTGAEVMFYAYQSSWRYDPATDTWSRQSTFDAPAIYEHTAVWTGTEMIVWGGRAIGGSRTNLGGRYDPASDSWSATSVGAGAPAARNQHTAVWSGTEMIVWGGTSTDETNTGARYDPATDSWTATSVGTNVPQGREHHTAVWTGTEMIVWGGQWCDGMGCYEVHTGGRYDPDTDSWQPTSTGSNVPTPRSFHPAVWSGTEMIVWGGRGPGFVQVNTGGRYDPATDSWEPTSTGTGVPSARLLHTAVWAGTQMIVWGGQTESGGVKLNTGGRYDPATDTWAPTSTGAGAPTPRTDYALAWSGSEMIILGGATNDGSTNTGSRYDPAADSWTPVDVSSDLPEARYRHTPVWTGTEMIVWGGSVAGGATNTGSRYDPATNVWTPTSLGANVPSPRSLHSAVWTGTEMIVWGGSDGPTRVNTGGRYDPTSDTWTSTSTGTDVPEERQEQTAVWTGTEMIVWGGWKDTAPNITETGGRYDPASDTWAPTSTGHGVPVGRTTHTAVWTGTEMIVWGGYVDGSPSRTDTGGRYDPDRDRWSSTSTDAGVPSARYGHTSVWGGTEMIVWGGRESTSPYYTDTGARYDPATDSWTPTSAGQDVPSPRSYQVAVWTGMEMIVWGGTDGQYPQTGGLYDPATDGWASTAIDGSTPPGRRNTTAVWTGPDDQRMIVWGGRSSQAIATGGLYCYADCAPLGPSTSLGFLEDGMTIAWSPQAGATAYDVVKGDLIFLRTGTGNFTGSISACLMNDGTDTQVQDMDMPATGQGFYYLIRSIGCESLAGTYDSGGIGQQGGRDAGIDDSPNACP